MTAYHCPLLLADCLLARQPYDPHATVPPIMQTNEKTRNRIYTVTFASVYPHYVTKAEKKDRTKAEVDEIIRWLTGYSLQELEAQLDRETDFETFFAEAPNLNPARDLIKGVICKVRVEDIEDPVVQDVRRLDKLIDELAKGKSMDKILRSS